MQRIPHALAGVMTAALLVIPAGCGGGGASPFIAPPKVTSSLATIDFGSSGSSGCSTNPCTTSFTVSEPGYNGTFSAKSSNTGVVKVALTNSSAQARKAQATQATFTVTAVSGGTATITVSDQNGNSTSIPVTVSSITFTPQLER